MKPFLPILALVLAAGAAQAQIVLSYPGDARVARAEALGKTTAAGCEKELNGGASGPACDRWHKAVILALTEEHKRLTWCNAQSSEASNIQVPLSCTALPADLKVEALSGLERKVAPKAWKAFDTAMGKTSL
jgi:hypothetical protein